MLELVYNSFDRFCFSEKFEFLEMDTDILYIAMSKKSIREIIKPSMKEVKNSLRSSDCKDTFQADNIVIFFHGNGVLLTINTIKELKGYSRKSCVMFEKYCCFNESYKNVKISCKGLNQCSLLNDNPLGPGKVFSIFNNFIRWGK